MEIVYKNYKPNQGLEDIHGKLFSMNIDRTLTGKEIRERFKKEKIDTV